MQFKKNELNELILQNAEKEFLQKGFSHASLRSIAKESGTTIGNLYHYFANKEALFDALVSSEYASFRYFLDHHRDIEAPADILSLNDVSALKSLLDGFIEGLMPIFTERFLLLLDKSEGTKYQHTRQEFIDILREHFDEHIHEFKLPFSQGFGRVISEQILGGILSAIADAQDETERKMMISELLLFYILGFVSML